VAASQEGLFSVEVSNLTAWTWRYACVTQISTEVNGQIKVPAALSLSTLNKRRLFIGNKTENVCIALHWGAFA
jgi:hypothetical protein